jgi:hypothetical protein
MMAPHGSFAEYLCYCMGGAMRNVVADETDEELFRDILMDSQTVIFEFVVGIAALQYSE